jgi:hypothetical protein
MVGPADHPLVMVAGKADHPLVMVVAKVARPLDIPAVEVHLQATQEGQAVVLLRATVVEPKAARPQVTKVAQGQEHPPDMAEPKAALPQVTQVARTQAHLQGMALPVEQHPVEPHPVAGSLPSLDKVARAAILASSTSPLKMMQSAPQGPRPPKLHRALPHRAPEDRVLAEPVLGAPQPHHPQLSIPQSPRTFKFPRVRFRSEQA